MRGLAIAASVLALGGCAAPGADEAAAPLPGGLPVAVASPVEGAPPARGQADFTVRTVAQAASGREVEVGGVDCTANSGGAVARFQSPARVVLPDVGQGIRVDCAGGGRSGAALVEARQRFRTGSLRAWPTIGISVGSGGHVGTGVGIGLSPVAVPAEVTYDDVRVALR